MRDIRNGDVFLLYTDNGQAAGTVTTEKNEINRLFVLPQYQGQGFGGALLRFAEERIAESYDKAELSVSLPAKAIYLKKGYTFKNYHAIKTKNGDYLWVYKFRTMSDERDVDGNLLTDEVRLGSFGKALRATSLDELPEAFNILKGDMSIIGPRPQLVRDMVFMTPEQRMRHTAKPGLSGLAQVMGRNAISWEKKLDWDLKYIRNISFSEDVKLVWLTFRKVFVRSDITASDQEIDVTMDYGDALLQAGKITKTQYDLLQSEAKELLHMHEKDHIH